MFFIDSYKWLYKNDSKNKTSIFFLPERVAKPRLVLKLPLDFIFIFWYISYHLPAWWNGRHERLKIFCARACQSSSLWAGIFRPKLFRSFFLCQKIHCTCWLFKFYSFFHWIFPDYIFFFHIWNCPCNFYAARNRSWWKLMSFSCFI